MTPIPLMVELCAGTAALSLRLARDGAKPPVSRMGAKTGYANAILRILGLAPGQGAAAYLWCEPDPGVRLLLEAYRTPGLAQAAAAIIRSWADEDPRALWERLRAQGPPVCPPADAGEVARWAYVQSCNTMIALDSNWRNTGAGGSTFYDRDNPCRCAPHLASVATLPAAIAPDAREVDPSEVARWLQIVASNRLINVAWSDTEGRWINTGDGGATFGGAEFCSPPERTAAGLDGLPVVGAVVSDDARRVDPAEVARFVCGSYLSYGQDPARGFRATAGGCWPDRPPDVTTQAERMGDLPHVAATIGDDARAIEPGRLPPGTVAYADPPYLNTTGYASDLPRADVVTLARRWAAAGATVCISEAEPIPELVAEGWHAVEITGERVGAARTFSKQKREWVTMNAAPAWTPSVQGSLF